MSMHKIPLTDIEREGLKQHGLAIDKPSQLSDAFRQGVTWATEQGKLDTARLEFMQFYGAQVRWGNDSEVCNVWWHTHWGGGSRNCAAHPITMTGVPQLMRLLSWRRSHDHPRE